ncbi:methyltransferase family protein [Mucilaginibacter sp. UYCu711]|uniref:methyltransferase family protein n=1 Tax=Mucilaginibacter sp. UYCu711 TaxID=3156339 RepID=UPI003D257F74
MKITVNATINAHKVIVSPLLLFLMWHFHNWSSTAFLYFGLHGTYTILWLIKQSVYPDKSFQQLVPVWIAIFIIFLPLTGFYIAPYLLISQHTVIPDWVFGLALFLYTMGIFFHYVGDAQKYFTLKLKKGLIEDGFFKHTRNPNYLGEILIYAGLTLVAWHWQPLVFLIIWVGFLLYNMGRKDRSMSRHPGFAKYESQTGKLFPKYFNS